MEALRKKGRQGETQDGFMSFTPPLNANVIFCRFFFESHPVYDQTQGTGAVFSWLYGYLYYLEIFQILKKKIKNVLSHIWTLILIW